MVVNRTDTLIHLAESTHYTPPRWLTATEVQVPYDDGLRFIDLVALDTTGRYPELHSIEVKVSRGDWLNELRKPEKSRPAREATDRHYLLAGSMDVFREDEVPEGWGVLVADGGRVVEHRPARLSLARADPPTPWSRRIVTAFLRRVHTEQRPTKTLQQACRDAERKGYRKGLNAARRRDPHRAGRVRPKYDPGRYDLDDGIPLDLP